MDLPAGYRNSKAEDKAASLSWYVTLSHLRSKAQAVVHNWCTDVPQLAVVHNLCTTLVIDQNIHTIPTGIHHQQQQNKPTTTPECN